MQGGIYANFAVPENILSWQTVGMREKPFDADLVRHAMKARLSHNPRITPHKKYPNIGLTMYPIIG